MDLTQMQTRPDGAGRGRADPVFASRDLVVFDYDGTLANTTASILRTARQVLSDYGMSEEQMGDLRRLIGPPFPLGYELVYGIPHEDAVALTACYRQIYDRLTPDAWPLYPGIAGLLRDLKDRGRWLAVASSKRDDIVHRMLEGQGVLGLFDAVHGSSDEADEDKSSLVAACLADTGVPAAAAVMVGDRCYDIAAAHKVGLPGIGVMWGGNAPRSELEEAGADAIEETVAGLGRLLLGYRVG